MPNPLPPDILDAFSKLAESGKAINDRPLIVGGFPRDWLSDLPIEEVHDFDVICENGQMDLLCNDVVQRFGLGQPTEYDYTGTKKVLINGYSFEFQSATNPHVHFPIEDDLKAMGIEVDYLHKNIFERDFTINTICYDVTENQILDLTGYGVDDLLVNKLIRTPIPPQKAIAYNPFIILRMFRLMLEFDLKPEPELEKLIPYGVSLLPAAVKTRSSKFVKKLVSEVFEYNHEKAVELFTKYNVYDAVPMPKDLMDEKIKTDMGIVYQASAENLFSVEVDPVGKSVKVGFTSLDLLVPEKEKSLKTAIADLFLNDKIDKDYTIHLLGSHEPVCSVSNLGATTAEIKKLAWYKFAKGAGVRLYDRYQRRQEYRNRKRREQKRDRVDKIKSWRDFRSFLG